MARLTSVPVSMQHGLTGQLRVGHRATLIEGNRPFGGPAVAFSAILNAITAIIVPVSTSMLQNKCHIGPLVLKIRRKSGNQPRC